MSYSIDFRKKVLQVQEQEGLSNPQVAKRFAIGTAPIARWQHCLRPKKYTLKQPRKIDLEKLAQEVRECPDDYPFERAKRFGVKQAAICYALHRRGITYKKTLQHPKSDAEQRLRFHTRLKKHQDEGREIIDVDESGFAQDMPRCRGDSIEENVVTGNKRGRLRAERM